MKTGHLNHIKFLLMIVSVALLSAPARLASAQAVQKDEPAMTAQIDQLLAGVFPSDAPGAAVIVVRDGKVILRKGYGLANIELGVPIAPEMVFRLGSVAKQFTAMAILMLSEEGKLALSDEITEYLPDFPIHGQTITIENLLTHTSGVKDYEFLPARLAAAHNDLTPAELIALFQDEPLDFAPGEQWSYSNSGYILLGAIIEKVAGMSYADFIQQRIFTPLGMTHSYYDDVTHIIPGRVAGYSPTADGYDNAEYMSLTQAYAAGALASSVDDLARWDAALYTNKLVKQATLRQAFKPYRLKNGESSGYGYGWVIGDYEGHAITEHNGGINGFVAQVMRFPDDKVYVAILTNSDGRGQVLGTLAFQIAALVIGKPYHDPKAVTLPAATLAAYEGVYLANGQTKVVVRRHEDQLWAETGGSAMVLTPLSTNEFFIPDAPVRIKFVKNSAGEVIEIQAQEHFGKWNRLPKTDEPLPTIPEAVEVDPAILTDYVGDYEADAISLTISLAGDTLMVTPAGEAPTELIPTGEAQFELPAFDARIEFVRAAEGAVSGLIVHMGGQAIAADKTK